MTPTNAKIAAITSSVARLTGATVGPAATFLCGVCRVARHADAGTDRQMGDAAQAHDEQVQATGYPGEALARRDEPSVIDRHDVTMTGHPGGHIGLRA